MLRELSKRDKDWRRLALKICGCEETAHELVQEMYLKMHEQTTLKPFQNRNHESVYVYRVMKSIFINQNRANKEYPSADPEIWNGLDRYAKDEDLLEFRRHVNEVLDQMDMVDREVLLLTHEHSLRECEEIMNDLPFGRVSYNWFFRRKKEALELFKELFKESGIEFNKDGL